jgi:hypothetical protein
MKDDIVYVLVYDEMDEPADAFSGFTTREEADKYVANYAYVEACIRVIRIHVYDKAEDAR